MKIAHTAIVTPHRAGLYESVRDLVAAERALGAEAFIVDPQAVYQDRGVPVGLGSGLETADIIVNHSGIGEHESKLTTPVIHCLHGRPESSFRLESNGKTGVYSFIKSSTAKPIYRRWVTFWPEFIPYWSMLIPRDKLRVLTAPVDLAAWKPEGPSGYKFAGRRGEINIVIADMWREDVTPYHAIHAFCTLASTTPGCKLHLYGLHRTKALDVLLEAVQECGWLGEAAGMVDGLANVYRAATLLISPHTIATRAIREALACGCPVQRGVDSAACEIALPQGRDRFTAREFAEQHYDANKTAREMLDLIDEVLKCQA